MHNIPEIEHYDHPDHDSPHKDTSGTHLYLTPEMLLVTNSRLEVAENLKDMGDAFQNNAAILVFSCSDSRAGRATLLQRVSYAQDGMRVPGIRTIASAGDMTNFREILEHPGLGGVVLTQHFDMEAVSRGELPTQCGGLHAAADKASIQGTDIEPFINHRVNPELLVNSFFIAGQIRAFVDHTIPILMAGLDHRTGTLFSFCIDIGGNLVSAVPMDIVGDWERVFANGQFPTLQPSEINAHVSPLLQKFLAYNRNHTQQIHPDHARARKSQNPPVMFITDQLASLSGRYPGLHLGEAGNTFVITVGKGDQAANEAVAQAFYPVSHFSGLRQVVIETEGQQNQNIADELAGRPWFRRWKEASDAHQVMLATVQNSLTSKVSLYGQK